MLPVVIKDQALEDVQLAYNHLELQEIDLGEKLLKYIEEYIEIIEINPYLFKEGYKKVRQVRIKPFRYILHYKIYKDYIAVLQLFHGNKNPKKRLSK